MPRIRAESIAAHKAATRMAILDAAQKVFLANGYAGSSLTAIADVAGIPRTTLYDYFASKGHILVGVLEDRLPPHLDQVLAAGRAGTPIERINAIFAAGIDLVVREPELATLMFRVGRELPKELRDRMWDLLNPITTELLTQCQSGSKAGDFATRHPDRCGRVLADLMVSAIDELSKEDDPGEAAPFVLASRLAFVRGGLLAANSQAG